MKISVFGCGYVGLTTAACLADMGHTVIGVDTDEKKVQTLRRGRVPFFEPGMEALTRRGMAQRKLSFTTGAESAIKKSEMIICAVATPNDRWKSPDLSAVLKVADQFARHATSGKIFVNKSTVPVGTTEIIRKTIEKKQSQPVPFTLVYHPEFLREGTALKDFSKPDRLIFGIAKPDKNLEQKLRGIFKISPKTLAIFTSYRNAEIIKYASNAFLATRLSFVHELAEFCEGAGGNIQDVTRGMGFDPRIGHQYMNAGIGYGGSCLPKDLQVLITSGKKMKCDFPLLKAVQRVNNHQPERLMRQLKKIFPSLRGKKVAVWGLAFKPDTDDLRDAPSIRIVQQLLRNKAKIYVHDPAAMDNFKRLLGTKVTYGRNAYSVLRDADALLLLTEWREFSAPDFAKMKRLMRRPLIVDGRNLYDPQKVAMYGFEYRGMGR